MVNKVVKLIKNWESNQYINDQTAKSIKVSHAIPSRFYGLPKIRKAGTPMRPIVSYVGSATYALAVYIKNIISKNITTPKSRVLNSFDLEKK